MDPGDILARLVSCRSDQPDQHEIGPLLRDIMNELSLAPCLDDFGNASGSTGGEPSLAFAAHADTAGLGSTGWTANPLGEKRANDFLGRGAASVKGSIAAMLAAAARLKQEEIAGLRVAFARRGGRPLPKQEAPGTIAFLNSLRCSHAVCAEPTNLKVVTRHHGCHFVSVTATARRVHQLRGIEWSNPIEHMWQFCRLIRERRLPSHSELGRAIATVRWLHSDPADTLPHRCQALLERLTLPGEDENSIRREITNLFAAAAEKDATFEAAVEFPYQPQPPVILFDYDNLPRRMLDACKQVLGASETARGSEPGLGGWLADSGAAVVCFGPGDPAVCRGPDEKVDLSQLNKAADILYTFAKEMLQPACNSPTS